MRIFWLILAVVIIGVAIFFGYFGAFKPIKITEIELGEFYFVKKSVIGDYAQSGAVQMELYEALANDSIASTKGVGIYYDNPDTTPKEELRSDVGCIIDAKDTTKVQMLFKYELAKMDAGKYVSADFPFKGQLSIIFGVLRVYPKLAQYLKKHQLLSDYSVEIYDVPQKKVQYMFRLQDSAIATE